MSVTKKFDLDLLRKTIFPILSENNKSFVEDELGRGYEKYIKRIKFLGLNNLEKVLDAGGGVGNWAIPLAELNNKIEVVDLQGERLFVGKTIADSLEFKNINFINSSIESLPYNNSEFDAIICYSVIMFTDIEKTLSEFYRVLKPNGKLYVMTDLWRWYVGDGSPKVNKLGYYMKLLLLKALSKPIELIFKRGIHKANYLTQSSFMKYMIKSNFKIVSYGQDGEASFIENNTLKKQIFYSHKEKKKEELLEVCAIK